MWLYNPRIDAEAPHQSSSSLGFKALLRLVANSTRFRALVMRNVVIFAAELHCYAIFCNCYAIFCNSNSILSTGSNTIPP